MKNKKKGRDELNYGKQKKLTQNDNKNNEKDIEDNQKNTNTNDINETKIDENHNDDVNDNTDEVKLTAGENLKRIAKIRSEIERLQRNKEELKNTIIRKIFK